MNKISFEKAQKLWENLNTIESAFLGYTVKDDLHSFIEKMPQKPSFTKNDPQHFQKPEYPRIQKPQENINSGHIQENTRTTNIDTSSSLYAKMQECTRCALHQSRKQAIEGRGVKNPLVLVITEAPTMQDDESGIPMSGEDGKLLSKMLQAISLSEDTNTYITPIIKCRPPENKLPLLEQMYACKTFLDIQIQKMQPRFILALGSLTSLCLLGPKQNFQDIRGKVFDYKASSLQKESTPLLVSYSPQTLLHDEALKRPAWQDLKLVRRVLDDILMMEGKNK